MNPLHLSGYGVNLPGDSEFLEEAISEPLAIDLGHKKPSVTRVLECKTFDAFIRVHLRTRT